MRKILLVIAATLVGGLLFSAGMLFEHIRPTLSAVAPPKLLAPEDGAILQGADFHEFKWSSVPDAEKYFLHIAHSTTPDRPTVNQEVDGTVFALSTRLMPRVEKGWTWKTRARVNGKWLDWSEVRVFGFVPPAE